MKSSLIKLKGTSNNYQSVTPAQAGVQQRQKLLDFCFCRNDIFRGCFNHVSTFSGKSQIETFIK
jgi:hypothetical protein